MPFAAACSQSEDCHQALDEVCREAAAQLPGGTPDLSLLFVSRDHLAAFESLIPAFVKATGTRHLLACTADSLVAGDLEIEAGPAISLWCGILPGAELESFHVQFERTPDGPICSGLPDPPASVDDIRAVLLLADPFSCAVDTLIARLEDDLPGIPLIGGMAAGGAGPGENRLGWNDGQVTSGGVGVIIRGGPRIQSVVSQGCRPIGSTFVITKAEQNVVFELGGKTALSRLEETYAGLSERDRKLIRHGLHLGIAMDEYKPAFARGDFLIANVLGADRDSGAMAIGHLIRPGQTVQFHVRDSQTADEDLRHMIALSLTPGTPPPASALLFTCNGRGTHLFSQPNHDAGLLAELCGPLPTAGFFAQGELGPVGGRNYIHGFTASIALFDQS